MKGKAIFSSPLQEFRPVIWYGQPVHTRYKQLKSILAERLGDIYADILAEPVVSKEAMEGKSQAMWMSSYVENPLPFNKLSNAKQEEAGQLLSELLKKIKKFAAELKLEEDASISELGELLLMAIEVPGTEYVFVEDDRIVLVLWGFTSEKAEKTGFRINKAVEKTFVPVSAVPPIIEEEIVEKEPEKNPDFIQNEKPELKVNQATVKSGETPIPPVPPTPPVSQNNDDKKKSKAWLWMLIGALIMFLLLFLIWWFFLKNPSEQTYLPPENGVIPPIDTTKRGTDPDDPAKKVIFVDKLNIALQKGENIENFAKKLHEKYPDEVEVVYYDTVISLLQVKIPEGLLSDWTKKMKEFPEVRLVFNESLFNQSEIPTDPAFSDDRENWYFEQVQAYSAWDITKGSEDIVVAIIDNGFDLNHVEFKGKIVKPWNVFLSSDDVHPANVPGGEHGTHVAATAVGLMNNGQGLSGIAPNCKLMPIQVADDNGNMTSLSIVSGILYAIHKEADVVNMSLGMMFPDEIKNMTDAEQLQLTQTIYPDEATFWNELYQFVAESDIVFVQAAGNDNILAGIDPGARSKNNIIVSAVAPGLDKAEFSNYGAYSTISAPGVQIYSAIPGNKFEELQGTSMASPIVTGAAALVKSKFPNMKPEEIVKLLVNTAKPFSTDQKIGPLLQIENALKGDTASHELVIPDDAKDLSFAEGRWKSTTDLHSTIDQSKVSLYFDIKLNGKGVLTLVEETQNGATCKADLEVKFESGKLVMKQKGNAECENNSKFYRPYNFECVQGSTGVAECKATEINNSSVVIDFNLKKQ